MEENQTPTSPIAGEPALVEALSALDLLIDMKVNPHLYHSYDLEDGTQADALKDLRATVQKAMDAIRSEAEERLHDDGPTDEATEGEIRAEAEAERQADARRELAAELASCDWEGWY